MPFIINNTIRAKGNWMITAVNFNKMVHHWGNIVSPTSYPSSFHSLWHPKLLTQNYNIINSTRLKCIFLSLFFKKLERTTPLQTLQEKLHHPTPFFPKIIMNSRKSTQQTQVYGFIPMKHVADQHRSKKIVDKRDLNV